MARAARDFDLLIRAGRVVSPADGLDGPGAVAVQGDRVVASGPAVAGTAAAVLDLPDAVVLPGRVDLHAHPARAGSKYGVDPDVAFLPRGVTTVLSQGDAGAATWARYRETTIAPSRTRVRLAINLAASGESLAGGCFENLDDVDVDGCARAIAAGGDLSWGLAVNVGRAACGATNPREIMRRALEVATAPGRLLGDGPHHSRRRGGGALALSASSVGGPHDRPYRPCASARRGPTVLPGQMQSLPPRRPWSNASHPPGA